MQTEDDIARQIRKGLMTVDEAAAAFAADQVVVYPSMRHVAEDQHRSWQDVEDLGSGSTLFAALNGAGATPEQQDAIGGDIERLRALGKTIDRTWPVPGSGTSPDVTSPV